MGKAPASQFFWGDWLRDTELQSCSSATRGIWANALARMWFANPRGELTLSPKKFPYFLNCTKEEFDVFLEEAQALGFCYTSHNSNGNLTIRNRRMYREEKEKESNRLRQQRYYDKHKDDVKPNGDITPPSSSSSPSPNTIQEEDIQIPLRNNSNFLVPKEKIQEYEKTYPNINILHELRMIAQWNIDNPGKRKTKAGILRHINSWLMDTEKKRLISIHATVKPARLKYQIRPWAEVKAEKMREDK